MSNKIHINSLGGRIKFARNQSKLTQEELAKKLEVTARTLIIWEQNQRIPRPSIIQEIASITGSDAEWLNGEEDESATSGDEKLYRQKYEELMERYIALLEEIRVRDSKP